MSADPKIWMDWFLQGKKKGADDKPSLAFSGIGPQHLSIPSRLLSAARETNKTIVF